MAAVVRIDGESRGAQEAIQKVSTDLRGMASTATAASTQASSAIGGMATSFGRLTTAVFLGGSAVEVARKGLQFLVSATSDYIASSEEAQEQTSALTQEYGDLRMSVGRVIVEIGRGTGIIAAATGAFSLLNRAVEATFNPQTNERINAFVESLAPIAGITTDVRDLSDALIANELSALDASIATRALTLAQAQQQLAESNAQYAGTSYYDQVVTNAPAVLAAQRDLNAELERRAQLESEVLARRQSAESTAPVGGIGGRAAFAGGAIDIQAIETAAPRAATSVRDLTDALRGLKEQEIALAEKGDLRREAMIESFNETARIERERVDAIQAQAEREIEIERGKQAAIMELRATVKAADMAEQSEAAAAALELVRARQEAVADSAAQAFAGLANANEKFSKSVVRSVANQLAARGIEAIRDGVIQTIRGNPMGIPLGIAGGAALAAARGLGSSIAEGGGRGAGSQAAPVTNNNVSVNVVVPNGMQSDQVTYVTRAAEEGARRGVRQDRR